MISLAEINENNFMTVFGLKVSDEQKGYVAHPMGILARAYAKRKSNAQALAVMNGDIIVGVVMFLELTDEPACYTIEQLLIDHQYQNRGFGKQALKLVIDILTKERKYDSIEICVKKEAAQALKVYKDSGFVDTGYIDPATPDSLILKYDFSTQREN